MTMHPSNSPSEPLAEELRTTLTTLHDAIGGICADCINKNPLKRLLKTQDRVYWKRHGIVVSNRSLRDYRGASLTVEAMHGAAVVRLLEAIEPALEKWGTQPKPYYFQRLGQLINGGLNEWTCEECLQTLLGGLKTLLQETSDEQAEPDSNPFHET